MLEFVTPDQSVVEVSCIALLSQRPAQFDPTVVLDSKSWVDERTVHVRSFLYCILVERFRYLCINILFYLRLYAYGPALAVLFMALCLWTSCGCVKLYLWLYACGPALAVVRSL